MKKTLISVALGAGAMYLLDPELGEIRRSMLKDKLRGTAPKTADALHDKKEAVATKAHELVAQADDKAAEAISAVPVEHIGEGAANDDSDKSDQS